MTRLTDWLLGVSDRLIPSSSDQVLKLIRPASFQVSRHETREIALASLWGAAAIVSMVLMLMLSAAGHAISPGAGDNGLLAGLFLTWLSVAGIVIHGARLLAARAARKWIERAYMRRVGRPSSKDAALGQQVHEERPQVLLALTRSTDWDFVVQGVLGVVLTILIH